MQQPVSPQALRAEHFDAADGLPGNRVNGCVIAEGALWVATDSGLARFDPQATWFRKVAEGRFVKVAPGAGWVLAAAADGHLLRVRCTKGLDGGRDKSGCEVETVRKGLPVALSLAGNVSGGWEIGMPDKDRTGGEMEVDWAVGGVDGRVVLSNGIELGLDGPVLEVAASGDGRIVALTPDSVHELVPGPVQPVHRRRLPGEHLGTDGFPVRVNPPAGLLVSAVTPWRDRVAVGTDSGLYLVLPEKPIDHTLPPSTLDPIPLGGCPCGPRISSVEVFRGKLWAGGFDGGLCRLDDSGWTRFAGPDYLPSDMVNRLEGTRRLLYVATLKGLVTVDSQGRFRKYVEADCVGNLKGACPWHQAVPGVALDPFDATVWVADAGAVHNVSGGRWKHFFKRAGINTTEITRVAAGRDLVVVATMDSGLLVKERKAKQFHPLDERDGLADNWVMDVTVGKDGAIWAATCTRGVSRYQAGTWTTFTTREGLADDYTLSVSEIDGRMWIGTLKGVTVLTETGAVSLSSDEGLAGNEVHDVVAQGDRVWLATDGGLSAVRWREEGQR